jgi:acetolactate synthase-1/2/3 large subunit
VADVVQGARLAARALAAEGTDAVFTATSALDVLPADELQVLRTERGLAAAHAARAWGHARRTAGVAVVVDPGEVVPAVAESAAAQTPLVVVAARASTELALLGPVTKWRERCTGTDDVPRQVAAAFRHALAQPRGPVYLELAPDALTGSAAAPVGPARSTARTFGDPREVMKAADLLTKAERPVVLAGDAIWWDGAWKQLRAFAENGRLPVVLERAARGALPPEHQLLLRVERTAAIHAADVVCAIGVGIDLGTSDARLVHIHADATELGRTRAPDAGIVGDAAAVLGILADGVKPNARRDAWLDHLRALERGLDAHTVGGVLDRWIDRRTTVVVHGGTAVDAAAAVRVHRPGQWLEDGFGAASVLGLKAAQPEKSVVVVTDAGAYSGSAGELESAAWRDLPAVFVVLGSGIPVDRLTPALDHARASGTPAVVEVAKPS